MVTFFTEFLARLICMASLLIVDEATLLDRRNLEKMERTLRDLTGRSEPWGGKIIVLCGDFRQNNLRKKGF